MNEFDQGHNIYLTCFDGFLLNLKHDTVQQNTVEYRYAKITRN